MSATWPEADPEFEEIPHKSADPGTASTSGLAVVSLVFGIVGFFLPVVGPVTAIVSGHVARDEIRKARGRLGGDALARTGLILGYVWIALNALVIGCVFVARDARGEGPATIGSHGVPEPPAFSSSGEVPSTDTSIRGRRGDPPRAEAAGVQENRVVRPRLGHPGSGPDVWVGRHAGSSRPGPAPESPEAP